MITCTSTKIAVAGKAVKMKTMVAVTEQEVHTLHGDGVKF